MLAALATELLRATQAAALAAAGWRGRGDGKRADQMAVDAMRAALATAPFDGVVVIGEGEKDDAPMLFNGEKVGDGNGPAVDLAIDPLEGTRLLAGAAPNATSVIAAAPKGTMWSPGPAFYMDKLAVGAEARDAIDITASPTENLSAIAKALGKEVAELGVFVLEKPRHEGLIRELREFGARVRPVPDGDVLGALLAALPGGDIDVLMGIGGTPEGAIAACALKVLGGEMQCRLAPQGDDERERVREAGFDTSEVLTVDDLVRSDEALFVSTAITGGDLLDGIREEGDRPVTCSLMLNSRTGNVDFIRTLHPDGNGGGKNRV